MLRDEERMQRERSGTRSCDAPANTTCTRSVPPSDAARTSRRTAADGSHDQLAQLILKATEPCDDARRAAV